MPRRRRVCFGVLVEKTWRGYVLEIDVSISEERGRVPEGFFCALIVAIRVFYFNYLRTKFPFTATTRVRSPAGDANSMACGNSF